MMYLSCASILQLQQSLLSLPGVTLGLLQVALAEVSSRANVGCKRWAFHSMLLRC